MSDRFSSSIRYVVGALAILGLMLASAPDAKAQTYYWDGNDAAAGFGTASGTWSPATLGTTTEGWSTSSTGELLVNGITVTTSTTDSLNFGTATHGLGAGTINVTGAVDSGNITFGAASGEIVLSSLGTLNFGAVSTITVDNTTNTIDSILAGAGTSLIKNGTGVLVLTGTNTFAGQLSVQNGTVSIGTINNASSNGTLGNSAFAVILGNTGGVTGTLQYTGASASSSKRFTLATGGTGAFDVTTVATTLTLSDIIDGSGGLTKNGPGTLSTSAQNSFTGPITINGGVLEFTNNDAVGRNIYLSTQININNGATLRVTGTSGNIAIYDGRNYSFGSSGGGSILVGIGNYNAASTPFSITTNGGARNNIAIIGGGAGGAFGFNIGAAVATFDVALGSDATSDLTLTPIIANTGSVVKIGAGRLTFTGASTYTGTTTISNGTLQIGGGGATGSLYSPTIASGNLTFGSTGAITNNGALVYDIAGGFVNVNRTISGSGTVSATGNQRINFAAGTTINTTGSQTYSATATTDRYNGFTLTDSATVALTSSAGNISMTGMLGTANGNTGILNINTSAGNGNVTMNVAVGQSGINYGLNTLNVNAGTGTISLGVFNAQSWGTATTISLTGGAVNSTVNMTTFTNLNVTNSSASLMSAVLSGSGALNKAGDGTLTLSGANTYTGATTVNQGRLELTNQGGSNSSAYTIVSGATLEMNVASGTRTMGSSSTFTGAGSFVKSGGGNLVWGSATATWNFSSGALIDIQGGTFTAGSFANDVWTNNKADLNVAAGAIFDAVEATAVANGGVFVDAITGAGTIRVSFDGNYAERITFGVDNGSGLFSGSLQNKTTFAGRYVKAGTGTQTLSGTNTYTGTTTISGGTLHFARSVSLYNNTIASWTAANINVKSGATLALNVGGTGEFTTVDLTTLLTNLAASSSATNGMNAGSRFGFDTSNASGGTFTIADVIADSTGASGGDRGVTKLGTNTLILTADNTYTGTTQVNAGTLWANGQTLVQSATGTNTVSVNAGTTAGTLGGNGRVAGAVVVNGTGAIPGTITAGTGPAATTLNLGNTLDLGNSARYRATIFSTDPGDASLLNVAGNVTFGATSVVTLDLSNVTPATLTAAYPHPTGTSYTILSTAGSITNSGLSIDYANSNMNGFSNSDFSLTVNANTVVLNFTPVPEPGTILALSAGLLGLGGYIRRKRIAKVS